MTTRQTGQELLLTDPYFHGQVRGVGWNPDIQIETTRKDISCRNPKDQEAASLPVLGRDTSLGELGAELNAVWRRSGSGAVSAIVWLRRSEAKRAGGWLGIRHRVEEGGIRGGAGAALECPGW